MTATCRTRGDGRADDRHPVSYHAVTRYCQRVLDVTVDWTVPPLSPAEIAEAHALIARTTVEAVRAAVLTPAVAAAVKLGLPFCRTDLFEAKMVEGCVTTIYELRPFRRAKMKKLTLREARRAAHAHGRRLRRAPGAK